jgi:hypothetical protein
MEAVVLTKLFNDGSNSLLSRQHNIMTIGHELASKSNVRLCISTRSTGKDGNSHGGVGRAAERERERTGSNRRVVEQAIRNATQVLKQKAAVIVSVCQLDTSVAFSVVPLPVLLVIVRMLALLVVLS